MASKEITTQIAVLGGGPAGYVAAIRAAQLGGEVVLVEEDALGGVCMNRGCIPTKALLKTSEIVAAINGSREFGVDCKVEAIRWDAAIRRNDRIVRNLNMGISQLLSEKGVTVLHGHGELLSERELRVYTELDIIRVVFKKLIIATGSEATKPPLTGIQGIQQPGVINSDEALVLTEIPESIVIIGGGVIGLEFASMFRLAGSKVTVLEAASCILRGEDEDVSSELMRLLKRKGVAFQLSTTVREITGKTGDLSVYCHDGGKKSVINAQKVLLATGRKPRVSVSLPLEMNAGAIAVNAQMETSVKGLYAAGDVIGGRMLAHLAYAEGRCAAENALGMRSGINYDAVPSCVYTSPEAATVGLTERQAESRGIPTRVGTSFFRTNGRALTLGEREGFVKIVADQDGVIIGANILGANASEMISELTLAIILRANASVLADMIHPHPALSEAIWEACGDVLGRSLHGI